MGNREWQEQSQNAERPPPLRFPIPHSRFPVPHTRRLKYNHAAQASKAAGNKLASNGAIP